MTEGSTKRVTASIAVIILAKNEALHIARAIEGIRDLCSQVFVIDAFSTDDTVALAEAAGATVLQNSWVNYALQFAWAQNHAPITADWIMRLDADEVIGPVLVAELKALLPVLGPEVGGVVLNRRHVFLGRWIKHGGRYPLPLLRLWRRGQGAIEDRWMDEHIVLSQGTTVTAREPFSDVNLNNIGFFTRKHESYATREAIDVLVAKYRLSGQADELAFGSGSDQASFKRLMKTRFYNALPFWISVPLYFLARYILQFGFLDGVPGLIYHFLQGFWYRFLVGAKIYEYEHILAKLESADERRTALSELTGHRI